jgi:hypothetical protein
MRLLTAFCVSALQAIIIVMPIFFLLRTLINGPLFIEFAGFEIIIYVISYFINHFILSGQINWENQGMPNPIISQAISILSKGIMFALFVFLRRVYIDWGYRKETKFLIAKLLMIVAMLVIPLRIILRGSGILAFWDADRDSILMDSLMKMFGWSRDWAQAFVLQNTSIEMLAAILFVCGVILYLLPIGQETKQA